MLMYTLIHDLGLRRALRGEAVPLVVSLATAEAFYKFHSFTLECVAFLATWAAVSCAAAAVPRLWRNGRAVSRA
jgi:hypothetical protein